MPGGTSSGARSFVCKQCRNERPASDLIGGVCKECRLDNIDPRHLRTNQ